ncbi:MAG: NAD(P)H-quinone oxidoreductase [Gemmatimonadetes bacterium]|uniref:NAD(P)H-quinone oxidoreductase n=1 Tax=Candidatus Kutchimonas denitrificans TaxID=3056748 RepID=A0AAE4Z8M3_9BACT|nr:NAD(P)H-quinone oxidoreductase [Gemmatimonadota bacterium]NIR74497.1 NAD(P)H-quinone oxidoreductase [Candidatus Kutchimonas denitrificans]NIS02687.1 NAD(P)H-quinone oxidoreductase [Gemmatimonadota bacterium]NIT68848.1 NAD(P)H-quinone oxidoreductase [Gemmatimonadota bacterium]NIU52153.1 zinc-binding dehydrogenase [Gemmatimonadota bacterium]
MRALVISEPGGPEALETREVPLREPGRGEIRVAVHYAGVNRADLLQRRGHYPPPPGWPEEIPGLEYGGLIEGIGDEVEGWRVGDRVMGLVGGGGYAEYVIVSAREALPVPELLSLREAAAVPEVFITAHDALFSQLDLDLGDRLLIHAVGSGVGTAALQLAKVAGATVIGTSRSEWKLQKATEYGLDVLIDTSQHDFVDAISRATGGKGVHAILDLVGSPYLAGNLSSLTDKGRMIIVGLIGGRTANLDMSTVLRKRLRIIGTALRHRPIEEKIAAARAFEREVGSLLAAGQVRPIVHSVFPFEKAAEAHRLMEKNENFGKILLEVVPE